MATIYNQYGGAVVTCDGSVEDGGDYDTGGDGNDGDG